MESLTDMDDLVLNSEKCGLKSERLMFFGWLYHYNGVCPHLAKVSATADMSVSNSTKETHEVLGMAI